MALRNAKRHLSVETPLGLAKGEDDDDPFLLLRVSGAEGISIPYAFELTLLGDKKTEIRPEQLIGRAAKFGIRKTKITNTVQEEGFNERFGLFETFEHLSTLRGRRIYRARLVPAFRMTGYELRYRVFEDRDLISILREVFEPFPLIDFRTNLLADLPATRIPYCVQYNETTFAFVHRLLDRCGVAYRFEHGPDSSRPGATPSRERMVLSFRRHNPGPVDDTMTVVSEDGSAGDTKSAMSGKGVDLIRNFRRSFTAAAQNARVGDFNQIDPQRSPEGLAVVDQPYAFAANSVGLRAEAFPATAVEVKDPDAAARLRMRVNETASASFSGRAYSSSFYAGRAVNIGADKAGSGAEAQSMVLKLVTLDAFDVVDDRNFLLKIGDLLKSAIFGGGDPEDAMGQGAEKLRDELKKDISKGVDIANWLAAKPDSSDPSGLPGFIANAIGRTSSGIFGAITSAISAVTEIAKIIDKLLESGAGFACAFDAVPTTAPLNADHWPTPSSPRPLAAGPHFAMVLGPKGTSTAEGDIHTDGLGRVRIRFPWDQGPPGATPDAQAEGPFANDKVTAWVRVAEGWAGTRFGTQFVPRIGQEVIVSFLDGDPERPLVTGRVYNAGSGKTHLPFVPPSPAARPIQSEEDVKATQNNNTTRSGIRTRSTPQPDAEAGFHLLRFDDQKGKEQLLLRAEHRLDTTSTGSRFDTTRGSRHTLVGGGKKPADQDSTGGDFTTIGGEKDLHVGDSRYTRIDVDDHLLIKGDQLTEVTGGSMLSAAMIVLTADTIALQAKKKIQLVVGGSMVVITPAGVFTEGPILDHKGASPDQLDAPTIKEPLDAAEADPGDPSDWLVQQAKKGGGGGGRKSHDMALHTGMMVRNGPEGTLVAGGERGGQGIVIDPGQPPDPAFVNDAVSQLQDLRDDPATAPALAAAEDRKNPVVIGKPDPDTVQSPPFSQPTDPKGATPPGHFTGRETPEGDQETGTGTGSPSLVVLGEPDDGSDEAAAAHRKAVADTLDGAAVDDRGANDDASQPSAPRGTATDPGNPPPSPHPLPPPPPPPLE
ncbi:type VI secretion system Vgr family protein [Roseococcus sp.]|uniref:type VI secretion system Vgr family protein n=1 Tax=Roseococcus sp. TaxID=2109646 RepID=UPI003BAB6CDB